MNPRWLPPQSPRRKTDMWKRLHRALRRLWRLSHRGRAEDRVAHDRARFWAEVRRGQREAEANSSP